MKGWRPPARGSSGENSSVPGSSGGRATGKTTGPARFVDASALAADGLTPACLASPIVESGVFESGTLASGVSASGVTPRGPPPLLSPDGGSGDTDGPPCPAGFAVGSEDDTPDLASGAGSAGIGEAGVGGTGEDASDAGAGDTSRLFGS